MDIKAKFVNVTTLRGLRAFPRCPDNDEYLSSLASIDRNHSLLIFISHCWLRGDATPPHPDNEEGDKYQLCIRGIEKLWKVFAPRMKHCFVWMDYCCMSQDVVNLSDELSNYDKIVECCDVIFTPIVDPDHASWRVNEYSQLRDLSCAKSWREGPRAYLNRAWCRVEMLYAAHIPVLNNINSEVRRHTMFESGLAFHCGEGRRLHALYGTKEFDAGQYPHIVPPLQYRFLEDYHPLKGEFTRLRDREAIKDLLTKLKPYMDMNTKELGYNGIFDVHGRGQGKYRYPSGAVYDGSWEVGLRHGYGVYRYADGGVFEGSWENDKKFGHGVYRYADGSVYEGSWVNNSMHGHGKLRYADGDVYNGSWADDKKHGHGVYQAADGAVYDGGWENDLKHGYGVLRNADGGLYKGNWENNNMNGFGILRFADGDVYEGNWFDDLKHGRGVMQYANGGVYEGHWVHGVILDQENVPNGNSPSMFDLVVSEVKKTAVNEELMDKRERVEQPIYSHSAN